ncbi:MAG: LysE family transporter [Candidatus Omnitrophota bacterium]
MENMFFLKGLIIGLLIAAPVGPIGILCVNRTLSGGRMAGFVSGLGAVTGDGFYAAVAAYGITVITSFLSANRLWLTLAGGVFLAIVGIRVMLTKVYFTEDETKQKNLAEYYVSAVLVTLSNPVTVVIFGAVFAILGLGHEDAGLLAPTAMVLGVIAGAALCWFLLSWAVNALRSRFSFSALEIFNRISGAALMGFSCLVAASALGFGK